jgi:hypothetical protein
MLLRITTIMALALAALATPASASYETGWYAYSAGDFATARREWLPWPKAATPGRNTS